MFLLFALGPAIPGCFSKGEAPPIRYFQPPLTVALAGPAELPGAAAIALRVEGAPHLGESVVWQDDGVEIGFYADRRWVSPPGRFLEDALRNELFAARGFQQSAGVGAARLDVELVAFDEERRPEHAAVVRVEALYRRAGGDKVASRTASSRVTLFADDPVELARALATGLERVSKELGDWVETIAKKP